MPWAGKRLCIVENTAKHARSLNVGPMNQFAQYLGMLGINQCDNVLLIELRLSQQMLEGCMIEFKITVYINSSDVKNMEGE
jgi:hypothetical protein